MIRKLGFLSSFQPSSIFSLASKTSTTSLQSILVSSSLKVSQLYHPYSKSTGNTPMSSALTIVTHSGSFHADEALACFLLKQTDKYENANIVRSRDPKVIDASDICVDVGAVYDHSRCRYDHHQAGFTEVFEHGYSTKLSSAGLIYKHYGKSILSKRYKELTEDAINTIFLKIYGNLIEEMDGMDNGIERYPSDVKAKYQITTNIGQRVAALNPNWNEVQTEDAFTERFHRAVAMMGECFVEKADYYARSWLPARSIVEESVKARMDVHSSGEIIILSQHCPWKEHLYNIEKCLKITTPIKFVLYSDTLGSWRIQGVNIDSSSFLLRKAMPESWRGKRDEELSQITGIPGCIFTHANGFIGGNQTKDGAMKMAINSL